MAERTFEVVLVAASGDDLPERVLAARERGLRLEAISLSGRSDPAGIGVLTWIRDPSGPAQLVGDFVGFNDLIVQYRGLENAGYAPALVSAVRDASNNPVFRVIYERLPRGERYWPKLLFTSRSFDAFRSEIFSGPAQGGPAPHARYSLRSAYVLESLPGSDALPWFLGVLWPYRGRGLDWNVTYWQANELRHGYIQSSPLARAMAVGGRPWIVSMAYERRPSTGGTRERMLVVWRDRFFSPWPTPRPFDQQAGRELQIDVDWAYGSDLAAMLEDRRGKGRELLSWSVRGTGDGSTLFSLNFIPTGAEVQRRTFVMSGPGSLTDAADTSTMRFVGDAPPQLLHHEVVRPWLDALRVGPAALESLVGPRPHPTQEGDGPRLEANQVPEYPTLGDAPRWRQEGPRAELTEGPEYPTLDNAPTHPFDLVMWRWMRQNGARAAQLAVNRRGKLRFSRAYTWAEDGYPITKTGHRMRSASVSKNVNAIPLVRHYLRLTEGNPADPGIDRSFHDELQIDSDDAAFRHVTVRQALAHTTGMTFDMSYDGIVRLLRPNDEPESDELGPIGDSIPAPGEMRLAFESWPTHLVVSPPGQSAEYNNWPWIGLAELWGGIWFGDQANGWSRYDEALRDSLLRPAGVQVEGRAGSGSTYEQCTAQGEVAYHPHEIAIIRPDQARPHFWNLTPYVLHIPFSGNVCISMRQQARVLSLLTRRSGEAPYLVPEQKWIMAGRPAPGVSRSPLGWGRSQYREFFQKGDRMLLVSKDGGIPGTSAWVAHWFPGPGSALPEETTFDFAIAANADLNLGGPMGDLYDAAREVEAQGLWAPVDLTDGTEFDEDP